MRSGLIVAPVSCPESPPCVRHPAIAVLVPRRGSGVCGDVPLESLGLGVFGAVFSVVRILLVLMYTSI